MGTCFSSASVNQSPNTTEQLSSVATSRTTSNTTSSTGSSNVGSGNSQFSAASGGDEASPSRQILPLPNLRMFSFSELKIATRNFRSDTVLGEGGFGKVYKGWLDEKITTRGRSATVIAVKKLNDESFQGFQEWQSEVNFLGRLSHPNLVKLLGYCWEDKELLLIYEFMQKGSLENHLFGSGSTVLPLPWDTRLKILIGAARGLAFLHASDRKVIYRDFKASNILLDGSYNAKISDFGLAKMGPTPSKSHVTTRVMGTHGYAAPEYVATGHLYVKSDVYGFGVVLVEMLTGLRVLDESRPDGKHNLVEWVKPHLFDRRKLKSIMDSRLEGKYPSRPVIQIAQLALSCIESEPKNRPSMREIVEILERIDSVNEKHREVMINSGHRAPSRAQKPSQYRSPIHPIHDRSPINPIQDRSPIHSIQDRNSPIHPIQDRSPIHSIQERTPLHPRHDRFPIHSIQECSPLHPRHDRFPIHPIHDRYPIHPRHNRLDVNQAYPLPPRI